MRSALLLFSLIASLILAACPLPMNQSHLIPRGKIGRPRNPRITVTFICGKTGQALGLGDPKSVEALKAERLVTQALSKALKVDTLVNRISFVNSYSVPSGSKEEQLGYITVSGGLLQSQCPDPIGPDPQITCFGWVQILGTEDQLMLYMGIRKGLLGPILTDELEVIMGKPVSAPLQTEWKVFDRQFISYFMVPRSGPSMQSAGGQGSPADHQQGDPVHQHQQGTHIHQQQQGAHVQQAQQEAHDYHHHQGDPRVHQQQAAHAAQVPGRMSIGAILHPSTVPPPAQMLNPSPPPWAEIPHDASVSPSTGKEPHLSFLLNPSPPTGHPG
ncbi:hypothetical protein BDP27DRAFT_1433381 [Rhodocollybia butyracea]|uniref:Uncharacterized protein n=1 Tax=Rhodocollybia butyracea TaxID=206335 RepID=A0A9P5P791_9AGAR|nr:hypothetical protein BDP27DRAFT_1433381 [Rhodocollybia butyracea]